MTSANKARCLKGYFQRFDIQFHEMNNATIRFIYINFCCIFFFASRKIILHKLSRKLGCTNSISQQRIFFTRVYPSIGHKILLFAGQTTICRTSCTKKKLTIPLVKTNRMKKIVKMKIKVRLALNIVCFWEPLAGITNLLTATI